MSKLLHGCLRLTLVALLVALITSVAFLAGFVARASLSPTPTPTIAITVGPDSSEEEAFRVFWEAWDILKRDFYGDLPDAQEMAYSAIRGVIDLSLIHI